MQTKGSVCALYSVVSYSYCTVILKVLRHILCSASLEEANVLSPGENNEQIFEGRTWVSVTILQGILTKHDTSKCLFLLTPY